MLDFRKGLKYRQGLGPKRFRPLLMLILLMGMIALANDSLRDPDFWNAVDRMALGATDPMPGVIDRRPEAARDHSMPDSFRVAQRIEEPPAEAPTETPGDDAGGYFPGVRPSELRTIRDNRPSHESERPCAMRLLDILNKSSEASLREASVGPVTYAQLFQQPDDYRGRLVNVFGTVRGVEPIGIPKNAYGIKSYNRVWLYPRDNSTSPMLVYCLDMPEGFPTGGELDEQASLTGFFFKRAAYATPEADLVAPMLLAKTLHWQKEPAVAPEPAMRPRWLPLVITLGALAAMFAAWYVSLWARSPRVGSDRPPDFTQLRVDEEATDSSTTDEERKESR